jgi:hypothetical protein
MGKCGKLKRGNSWQTVLSQSVLPSFSLGRAVTVLRLFHISSKNLYCDVAKVTWWRKGVMSPGQGGSGSEGEAGTI